MTLKEQSAIIDKMSKENFDLKIKVFYLSDRLSKHSEEGVAEITEENVDLKVRLAELRKSNKALQKQNKELKEELDKAAQDAELEEEVIELREIIQTRETEIVTYQEHIERLEEEMRNMRARDSKRDSDIRRRGGFASSASNSRGVQEELEALREIVENETYKREQSDLENRRLRDDLWHAQNELAGAQTTASARRGSIASSDRPATGSSTAVSSSALATVNSRLRHENEDLRQKMAAQTSMLTSRNREKERLYQEIEELKIHLRNSNGGGRLSQSTYDRSGSRLSGITSAMSQMQIQTMTESEREDFENMTNDLRDKVNELKLRLSETETSYSQLLQELEVAERAREELEHEYENLRQGSRAIQVERDEALQVRDELEIEFENLRNEAEDEIRNLEEIIDDKVAHIQQLQEESREREESFEALQGELRQVTDIVVRLEDAQQEHNNTVEQLENRIREQNQIIQENEQELNLMEKNLLETNDKLQRANVQLESSKNEIRFLREEQDGDKMRIGELEREVKRLEMVIGEEKELRKDIERQLDEERRTREDKWEVREVELEKRLRERERELVEAKNETRHLKKSVHKREDEVRIWRERFDSLEKALRDALGGDNTSSKSGLIRNVVQHQKDLDQAAEELNNLRHDLAEKTRALRDRENRLESLALEVRKLTDLLDKERHGRKIDRQNLEALQNTHQVVNRNLRTAQSTQSELEKARSRDAKTVANLEQTLRDQITERNNLLTQLWLRLAKICGPEWMSRNSLAITSNGNLTSKTSMESAVVTAFPSFSQNIHLAVKAMENIFVGWKARMKSVERDLWKEYQIVENALDARSRRLERLEALVRGGIMSGEAGRNETIAKLRSEVRLLKAQNAMLENRLNSATDPSSNGSGAVARRGSTHAGAMQPYHNAGLPSSGGSDAEKRWILRLKELEKRLKKERESRVLDREGYKKRLEEERGEKEQARLDLEREKEQRVDLQIESGR
ncbi:hypothetical protein BJ508DRAFT_213997 [Ascobolus immersus RN42]|uniref:Centrosomin N-terminal motif 1 domain-containing protein n=1 Tax=Ascobolus immersus RN42 TaxID=1160509 RepID=A0A3N4HSM6_ASCIM|nr:hypothetical protein BJ508DRAFT_213997 [Ascobolus immersus RN42]